MVLKMHTSMVPVTPELRKNWKLPVIMLCIKLYEMNILKYINKIANSTHHSKATLSNRTRSPQGIIHYCSQR